MAQLQLPPGRCYTKSLETESCPERKGLWSKMLARGRARTWGVQPEPPAAGLGGEDKHVGYPRIGGALLYNECGEESWKLF